MANLLLRRGVLRGTFASQAGWGVDFADKVAANEGKFCKVSVLLTLQRPRKD